MGKKIETEMQKHYIMDLLFKKGLCITRNEIDRMTREQASKTINTLCELRNYKDVLRSCKSLKNMPFHFNIKWLHNIGK